jgi:segregation and condensation protein A
MAKGKPNEPAEQAKSKAKAETLSQRSEARAAEQQPEALIRTISSSSDWEEALTSIVVEQGLDPLNIDIIRLADAFMLYIRRLQTFDFRIPARFILIAAILLNMKAESILEKEEERLQRAAAEEAARLNLEAPLLAPPVKREAVRPVSLNELIDALNRTFEIRKRKEIIEEQRVPPARFDLHLEKTEDVEKKIKEIYERIRRKGVMPFSDLVPVWKRDEIIATFLPLLHLAHRGKVTCEQKEFFKEILIKLR